MWLATEWRERSQLKYIKLLLSALVILAAISVFMGYSKSMPIMLFMLAIVNVVTAWESYHKNKIDSILLFIVALFIGFVSIFSMFS